MTCSCKRTRLGVLLNFIKESPARKIGSLKVNKKKEDKEVKK